MEVSDSKEKGRKKPRFWGLSRNTRIAITILIAVVILSMASLFFYNSSTKFQILFSGLENKDAEMVIAKLKESDIESKIEGDSILVPKEKVDELRLTLASQLTFGSSGYELMDFSSTFGISDEEFKIKKLVMQQGELERTIKSFPQIENARVHITASSDSVFIENKSPAKAAVYISLLAGNKLTNEQVASIVALVSGAVENLPKENVDVIDNDMNLLSENIVTTDTYNSSSSVTGQLDLEQKYEEQLQKTVLSLLEPVFGKNKINVAINADLDFDSKQKTETIVDPESVLISQETLKESTGNASLDSSGSPVDNNTESEDETTSTNNINTTSISEQQTSNYETGKIENIIISAPGEVKRLTASIIIDGQLDETIKNDIINLVSSAIGFNKNRDDQINVLGIDYEKEELEQIEDNSEVFEQMRKEIQTKSLLLYGGIALGVIILIIIVIIIVTKGKNDTEEYSEDYGNIKVIDAIEHVSKINQEYINLDLEDPHKELENEIKRYATEKPNQVVDIIRAWLTENER